LYRAPLAYSQLAHWYLYHLGERPGLRSVASAMRLRGPLNASALRHCIAEIVRRHDALRTRIVVFDRSPMQEIDDICRCELSVDDLTSLPAEARDGEIQRRIDSFILEPVNVAIGPLVEARLIKLKADEHVLVIAMEHVISDAYSMSILLREIFYAFVQLSQDRKLSLSSPSLQFPDYAVRQRNTQEAWLEKHGSYWKEHFAGCRRVRFPADRNWPISSCPGWGIVPIEIRTDFRRALVEWSRARRTTLPMSIFTAYVGLVLRWCQVSESVIRYQSHGRTLPETKEAIGFFASRLYLRLTLREQETFLELLRCVTVEYCRGYQHDDFSYMETRVPEPEFARNTFFNWIPQGSHYIAGLSGEDVVSISPEPFVNPALKMLEWDNEPMIILYDADDAISGAVRFPLNRFSVETMEKFGRNFLVFVEALLTRPDAHVKNIDLV